MIITIVHNIENNQYSATITTEANLVEEKMMSAYGEPMFDAAGTIPYTTSSSTPGTFIIAGGPKLTYVRASMPVSYTIDGNTDPEASGKIVGWATEMKNRITGAVAALKAKPAVTVPYELHYEA